jgi:hypothetical protein
MEPTLHDYIVVVLMTLEHFFIVFLIMRIADYRWKEKEREGWTPELWERARKGENVWGIDGGEDTTCAPHGGDESHLPGTPYRSTICRDLPPPSRCPEKPKERRAEPWWEDAVRIQPESTSDSRDGTQLRIDVAALPLACDEADAADELEELDNSPAKATDRVMTQDGGVRTRRDYQ